MIYNGTVINDNGLNRIDMSLKIKQINERIDDLEGQKLISVFRELTPDEINKNTLIDLQISELKDGRDRLQAELDNIPVPNPEINIKTVTNKSQVDLSTFDMINVRESSLVEELQSLVMMRTNLEFVNNNLMAKITNAINGSHGDIDEILKFSAEKNSTESQLTTVNKQIERVEDELHFLKDLSKTLENKLEPDLEK